MSDKTLKLALSTGKNIEIDYRFDNHGHAVSVGIYGPNTWPNPNAGLSDVESVEVRRALDLLSTNAADST